ncbi:macrophage mannose receptor 1-like isoform X2 [Poecilia latipinna]|uniref:macrophage mannose receptor 1-like isoform X2 n=1 Tax=Poecilia latipinna TaxID=48699 RepID=UPI00072E76D6|nr:PREDICTED: macrophage mannose receptor 1-like isoform X2 [Poecilia latipinna]
MRSTCIVTVLLLKMLECLALDDSPFQLTNTAGFCLVKTDSVCQEIRWTTADRLLVPGKNKCLGVQGPTPMSEVNLYDCDENSKLQKWNCTNDNMLTLQASTGQRLFVELQADNRAVLVTTEGPNSKLMISGTSSGACTRTYRELYTIGGNAAGRPCMFPFFYENQWYSSCTLANNRGQPWCSVETKYEHQTWGFCPTNNKESWIKHPTSGALYQLNTESALTWSEAETSCKQQSASLLTITDPQEKAYITALLEPGGTHQGYRLWTGLTLDSDHGWQWSNGDPFRYLNWDSGHPVNNPAHTCGVMDGSVRYAWQSSTCNKKFGYICYSKGVLASPTAVPDMGHCSAPWVPYNGHCFQLYRNAQSWSGAQQTCRKDGGDLASIRNMEDHSFITTELGYASTDELWIGLNDKKTEGLFDWTDHTTVTFTSWQFGKPQGGNNQNDCVLVRGENGNWDDRDCKESHGFICMKASASEPTGDEIQQDAGCKTGWKRYGSYCYFIGTERKTFGDAKEDCKRSNSYLADVSNRVDNAFLVSLVGLRSEKHFWLGLSNQKNRDVFEWTSTTPVRYTHWNRGMPGHNQGCVAMTTGSTAGLWDVLPCTNRQKYICKYQAEGTAPTPAPTTPPSDHCADGWTRVQSRYVCHKIFSESKSWFEARDYCRGIGGDLMSFHSAAEMSLNRQSSRPYYYRSSKLWIGLSANDQGTGYVWSDGSPVNFQHWQDGEPNNKNNVESCVEFYSRDWDESGSWNDNQCEARNGFVCQIRTGLTPKSPPPTPTPDYNRTGDGWLEWGGNQYYFENRQMANEDARKSCRDKHADLVTINSEAERIFLWKQLSRRSDSGSVWIGLTVDLDKSFQWMDGSPVIYQMWDEGQPNFANNDENCVCMRSFHGFWHDYNCGFEFGSICKRSSSPPVNATVAPTAPPKGNCKDGWQKINSKCYKIISDKNLTWVDARKQCRDYGGNLASIPSRHEQVFLVSEMTKTPNRDLWIGFQSSYGSGFYWTDGRPRSYVNLEFSERRIYHFSHRYGPLYHFDDDIFVRRQDENKCAVINANPSFGIGKWIPKSCNDTNGFICSMPLKEDLPNKTQTNPENYFKILNDSIKLVTQQKNWYEAQKACEADGDKLVSVRTEWTQAYIELLALNLNRSLWIGLNKNQTKNYFQYVEGWPLIFTRWNYNEPRRDGICVYVDVDGKWKTNDCSQEFSSLCMKSTDIPPEMKTDDYPGVCPEDPYSSMSGYRPSRFSFGQRQWQTWKPFRGFCYLFSADVKEWQDATTSCLEHGGSLASIGDPFEQEFILNSIKPFQDSHTSYWMGLYKTNRGEWKWLDNTVMDFENWQNYPSRPFGMISASDGKWHTGERYWDKPYICKAAKVLLSKPSSAPSVASSPQGRGHAALSAVLVIVGIAVGAGVAFFLFKKSGRQMMTIPIPGGLTAFDNPLFSSNRTQKDLVDTKKLLGNADEDNSQPVITI